ncbi:MAG: hypothetical protein EOP62_00425 [Sphingomonadales bacterium]|nr:MAG: hypothetical protein EOP62_00425 [Sphingomonadales bacterium]
MTSSTPSAHDHSVGSRILALPLGAIGDAPMMMYDPSGGELPGAIEMDAINLVVASTHFEAPRLLDTIALVSCNHRRDLMLVRAGIFPETFNPVTVDVALDAGGDALVLTDRAFFRHVDRTLWLVPEGDGPFIEICQRGLRLEMISPFLTSEERVDGLCRAAAEIVRLTAQGRGR